MQVITNELHLHTKYDGLEVYTEKRSDDNVERLWYDRLSTNPEVTSAYLVSRIEHTGKVISKVKVK